MGRYRVVAVHYHRQGLAVIRLLNAIRLNQNRAQHSAFFSILSKVNFYQFIQSDSEPTKMKVETRHKRGRPPCIRYTTFPDDSSETKFHGPSRKQLILFAIWPQSQWNLVILVIKIMFLSLKLLYRSECFNSRESHGVDQFFMIYRLINPQSTARIL